MSDQIVFQRYEQKYLLSQLQYQQIMECLPLHMHIDQYGKSKIHNIYFDTKNYLLIRRSIEKPVPYKEKLRLRCYGSLDAESKAFIELKKKYKGIVYKRRLILPLSEAETYLYNGIRPQAVPDWQIAGEIDWFLHFYEDLQPSMAISYDRMAYYGLEDPLLRVTFDDNILWRQEELDIKCPPFGKSLLLPGEHLMEVKCAQSIPLWMAQALSDLHIFPASFSKYGNAYKTMFHSTEKQNPQSIKGGLQQYA